MRQTHILKCWPEPFEATASGLKPVEVRRSDDRTYCVGDWVVLCEWDPVKAAAKEEPFTGRRLVREVTHIASSLVGINPDKPLWLMATDHFRGEGAPVSVLSMRRPQADDENRVLVAAGFDALSIQVDVDAPTDYLDASARAQALQDEVEAYLHDLVDEDNADGRLSTAARELLTALGERDARARRQALAG